MAKKSTEKKKTSSIEDDEIISNSLVFNPATEKYVPRYKTSAQYEAERKAEGRQAAVVGAGSMIGAGLQFGINMGALSDPAMKEMGQEKARLKSDLEKGPDLLTESEKQERTAAATAGAQRQAEAAQRRAEAIMASTGRTGDVRSLLAAGEVGVGQIAQAQRRIDATLAAEDVAQDQLKQKKDQDTRNRIAAINKTQFDMRQKFLREGLSGLVGDLVEGGSTILAYQPTPSIDKEIELMRDANIPPEEISEVIELFDKRPREARRLIAEKLKSAPTTRTEGSEVDAAAKAAVAEKAKEAVEDVNKARVTDLIDPNAPSYKYVLQDDGQYFVFRKQDDGSFKRTGAARPGTKSFEAIDALFLEANKGAVETPAEEPAVEETPAEETPAQEPDAKIPQTLLVNKYIPGIHEGSKTYRPKEDRDIMLKWNEADQTFSFLDSKTYEVQDTEPISIDDLVGAEPGSIEAEIYQLAIEDKLINAEGK